MFTGCTLQCLCTFMRSYVYYVRVLVLKYREYRGSAVPPLALLRGTVTLTLRST